MAAVKKPVYASSEDAEQEAVVEYCDLLNIQNRRFEKMKNKEKHIEEMTHEEVYQRYKEKKKQCRTIAQEVEMITSDHEMILLREMLMGFRDETARQN